jgi:hypothetical protein
VVPIELNGFKGTLVRYHEVDSFGDILAVKFDINGAEYIYKHTLSLHAVINMDAATAVKDFKQGLANYLAGKLLQNLDLSKLF